MPFEVREIFTFVCPRCRKEQILERRPAEGEIVSCPAGPCQGREAFRYPAALCSASVDPASSVPPEPDRIAPAVPDLRAEPPVETREQKSRFILVSSATLISAGLIATWFLFLYLIPLLISRCSKG